MARHWDGHGVTLFKQNNLILAEHLFMSADLHRTVQPASVECSPAILNETLFALGIVLIELCMGQSFDSLHHLEDLNTDGTKHAASGVCAANRLVDKVYD